MKQFKLVLAGLAAVLLSGCALNVDTMGVAGMQTTRDGFKQALHKEYVALAKSENDEGDGADAEYFLGKAKDAGLGLDVLPQQMGERNLQIGRAHV